LYEAIHTGRQAIWAGAVLGGLFLYGALFWLTRRADNLIQVQQERLVQSETLSAMGEMSSAVAHGIRNPLASIRSSAELALEFASADAAEPARDIIAEVDRMENWVRELLSYARPEAIQTYQVDLAEMVTHILADFERDTARRGIVTEFKLADNLPQVKGDHLLLGQVISSLISNSVEAMVVGGHISLSAERVKDRVLLRVRDNGPGVSSDQMPRVFKPFFTTKPKGLGVGLAQAKRIIERFGGDIQLFSEPGSGVTVEVRLRIAEGS
jgi:signal transduction histidine kinase